jgi:two-component system, OmpR family, sensor histidine kinase VanS
MQKIQNISKQSGAWDIKLKNDFHKLKSSILLRVIFIPIISLLIGWIILVLFIDGIFQDSFARTFVYLSQKILRIDNPISLYQHIFRNNKTVWIILGYTTILLIIFYRSLTRLIRYFNEVNNGLDYLLEETEEEIILSPEIETIEKKLNRIKATLKKRELDAQFAEQRKNDLVVYLAHDIKTPLTSVIGYLSLLDEAPDMPIEQKIKYTAITLEKAFRLEQLINEFFEITRYNLQSMILDKQEIDLSFMLLQMTDEFYPQLSCTGKTAKVNVEEHLVLLADGDKLARVFNNIMKNAIAYGNPNTVIDITAICQDDHVLITFINQGNTIPEHKLQTIFDKFYRLDDARSTNTGGSGLGLAIAKSIVEAHGGNITAESRDGRTTFSVKLPSPVKTW